MILIIDHINGVWNDNRIENLRLVCPNCNSQLETHCGKNKKIKKYYCKCGNEKHKLSKMCSKCSRIARRKVTRPDIETLKGDITKMNFVSIGKKYGVSDNAVRKWCKAYGLVV